MMRGDDDCESHNSPQAQLSSPKNEDRTTESVLMGGRRLHWKADFLTEPTIK